MPSRPRVAYLITKSETGGAQTHLLHLCSALQHEIEALVMAGGNGPLLQGLRQLGILCHSIPSLSNRPSPLRLWQSWQQLLTYLRATQPDILHAHSAAAGVIARLAGWRLGIPVVYTVHGFGFKPGAPKLRGVVMRLIETLLAPLTAQMICVSQTEKQWAHALPIAASRVQVIPNGMPDTPQRAIPEQQPPAFAMAARFASPKRQDLLLQAFSQATCRTQCSLVFAGEGPDLSAAQAYAQTLALSHAQFPGLIDNMPAWLARQQVFVLLSDHEGLPISIIEAMRAGLPILASDLPGIRELITHQREGLLVNNADPQSIASALDQLAASPTLRSQLGHAARHRYEVEFGIRNMAAATAAVYQQILCPSQSVS